MPRRRARPIIFSAAWLAGVWVSAQSAAPRDGPISGFSTRASAAQAARERELKALPTAKEAEADFDLMTAEPHHTGSPYAARLADYVAGQFKAFGFDVTRHEYTALIPWPLERRVDITSPDSVRLEVDEESIAGETPLSAGGLPPFNAYSPPGDVSGEIVYVNYGLPSDYDTLAQLGVDVKGKIVLARYGAGYRGVKPKVAAERGAIGCLIYSDPRDDGYFQGNVYPDGLYRAWGMIQRGSVMDLSHYPGDPLTPDRPSKPGVERLPMDRALSLARIPVQPLSYRSGLEILKRLAGPVVPENWRGALPITYHAGPGPATVHLSLQMDYRQRPVIDVIGRMRGVEFPDEWIIAGSHRDAWVLGAADSASGHVSMMAAARGLGEMARRGWRPRRTIVFASWDGEEQGLLGSTEWVEEFAAEIADKAAVYINRDSGAGGPFFSGSAVPSLTAFVHDLAKAIDSDQPGKTLYDRWLARAREGESSKPGESTVRTPTVNPLGSGSDYAAFLDHSGVSSLDIGLGQPGVEGTYHSAYDNPAWFKKFVDPTFAHSLRAAQMTGVAVMRLADAQLLPFDDEAYGLQIGGYVNDIEKQALARSAEGSRSVDFAGLKRAALAFARAGARARREGEALLAKIAETDDSAQRALLVALNRRAIRVERDLLEPSGLPDRPWYRHTIFAPGTYTGYGAKTIPGLREAVEAGNFPRAAAQARVVTRALERATRTLAGARSN